MKKKKRYIYKPFLKYIIPIIIGITFATIAYANTSYDLEVDGTLSLGMQEGVIISDVDINSISENSTYSTDHYVGTFLKNSVNLNTAESEVVLAIEIKNTDNVKYQFDGILYDATSNPDLETYSNPNIIPEVVQRENYFQINDQIDGQETKTVLIKFKYAGSDFSAPNAGLLNGTIKLNFKRVYSINYVLNGGIQAENQPTYYLEGQSVTLLEPTKTRSEFVGWYESDSHTGDAVTTISGRNEDITLYAYFHTYYDIYFLVPPSWYKEYEESEYTVKMYLFKNSDKSNYENWPGISMTKVDDYNYYKASLTDNILENYDRVVFSNGKISSDSDVYTYFDIDKKYSQTIDLDFDSSKWNSVFVPEIYDVSNSSTNEIRFFARSNQNLYYYLFNYSSQTAKVQWPGELFQESVGDSAYKMTFNRNTYDRLIINKPVDNGTVQTPDLEIPAHGDLTFSSTTEGNNGVFYFYVTRQFYDGRWADYNSFRNSEYEDWHTYQYPVFEDTWNQLNTMNSILH